MLTVTCPACAAAIRAPGGRTESVTRCPWCAADLRPAPPKPPPPKPKAEERPREKPPEPRPAPPVQPRPTGGNEALVATLILGVCAVIAVGVFFATRHLVLMAG